MSRSLLWLAIVAPMTAWTAQLLVGYFLVSLACSKGIALPLAWHGISVAAAALAVGALVVLSRRLGELPAGGSFVAQIAWLGAGVFLIGIAFGELSLVLVRSCG